MLPDVLRTLSGVWLAPTGERRVRPDDVPHAARPDDVLVPRAAYLEATERPLADGFFAAPDASRPLTYALLASTACATLADGRLRADEAWALVRPVLERFGTTLRLTSAASTPGGIYDDGACGTWHFFVDFVEARLETTVQVSVLSPRDVTRPPDATSWVAWCEVRAHTWPRPGSVAETLLNGGRVSSDLLATMNRALPGFGAAVSKLQNEGGVTPRTLARQWSERPAFPEDALDSQAVYELLTALGVDFTSDAEDKSELRARVGQDGACGWEAVPSGTRRSVSAQEVRGRSSVGRGGHR
ncbi:hypothetical protein [Deinococcus yavapaiensis]|uniref:Uncharacterized protein n=1 Tax=Deinococcus yavapaiensis KR-236 TaxID=694435 RepID=A0A318SF41_9DEIO|nr:hypothetical protein [Deinococcus yavapaiensis]PYE55322.1 hypothetical protein DES52_103155 [Deinococcus yavapaiensis KR-236]